MIKIIIIILIIILIFLILNYLLRPTIEKYSNRPIIWAYWETLPGKSKPGYIDLCLESIQHNCSKCFDIKILDNNTIYNFIPEIKEYDLSRLPVQQKVDIYRYFLLYKYGGIWLDADTLVIKCFCKYYKLLDKHDYIGFGCGYDKSECRKLESGYGKPINGIMISRPKTSYLKCIIDNCIESLKNDNLDYHDLGRVLMSKCYDKLSKESDWKYHHVPSKCQEYDSKGNKLNNIFKPFNIEDCKEERVFFPLYNTAPGYPEWFKKLSKDELMKRDDLEIYPLIEMSFKTKRCY